ncbi:hypothetical protein MTP04_36730 [Lysinibacillus sp. PLM2]|nr:hypothetical protein MTP04_36730 [Lysinibacillus sp. PLM2]
MCDKHFTRIESKCNNCGCEQPYVNKSILEYMNCNYCGELLYDKIDMPLEDIEMVKKQLRIHRDWGILTTAVIEVDSNFHHPPQSLHRKIALLLLFLATPENTKINSKKHPFFTPSQVKKLLALVRNKSNEILSLGFILNTLREKNIEISNLISQKVPMSFVRVLFNKNQKMKKCPIKCKSTWCKSFNTNRNMMDLVNSSKGKYVPKLYLYSSIWICTNCWFKWGFNKKLSKWEDIYISKNKLFEVNSLIEMNVSVKKIGRRLKMSEYKVYYYIGYLYRYNPFCNIKLKIREFKNVRLKEDFFLLKPFWRNHHLLAKEASRLFGWDHLSTFYYYWHPKVQEYIYLEDNSRVTNRVNQERIKNNMNGVIKELENSNKNISINEIAASLDITDKTLYYHGLHKKINDAKLEHILNKKAEEEAIIFEKIDNFIKSKKNSEEQFFVYEVYKFIGLSLKYIKINYPEVSEFISKSAKISKYEQKEIRRRNLENAIINICKQYGRVDYSFLSESLGVKESTLKSSQGIYKGIRSFIKKILNDLEEDKNINKTLK